MGALVQAGLSALKSETAEICPVDLDLDQFYRTYPGGYRFNFITALSGTQSFKNLNFTNFYLSNEYKLDNVTTFTGGRVIPEKIFSTLNFAADAPGYLNFNIADASNFREVGNTYEAGYYGYPGITTNIADADNIEIQLIDTFTCRVAFLVNNFRYYLIVSDENIGQGRRVDLQKKVIFAGENKIPLSAANLEYSIIKSGVDTTSDFICLFSQKFLFPEDKDSESGKYILVSDGQTLIAERIAPTEKVDALWLPGKAIKLGGEIDLTIPSPYNTSFVTYNKAGNKVDTDKSNFNLPSNYLLHSSSNSTKPKFDILNLKNIANNYDEYVSSNNLLSSSDTNPLYVEGLRKYTSIFSDIDSEKNEVLALNYVYNNFNVKIKPGSTIFQTPSSLNPFTQININDTKFVDSGAFCFTQPFLSDRVYHLDDEDGVKDLDATYLCTWLSGGLGERGVWVDRYFYPDLTSKEEALSTNGSFNITYDLLVEELIQNNSTLKTSVEKKYIFDKKSDLVFEPNTRYRYERLDKDELEKRRPVNFCEGAELTDRVNNYFRVINDNGGFALGFNIKSNSSAFTIRSKRNDINGGFQLIKKSNGDLSFSFNIFDNSPEPPVLVSFSKNIPLNQFVNNTVFLSFDGIRGECTLYVNSEVVFSFNVKAYQMLNKMILFGIIEIVGSDGVAERLLNPNPDPNLYIDDIYLTLSPLSEEEEISGVFTQNLNEIQDITISLPCGQRNLTDTIATVNSIGTNLKHRSNVVDINVKNLNIQDSGITEEVRTLLLNNITSSLPETTTINDVNFINYK
tara:strand:- start:19362 stop:21749 length:2388 start_codon:yes stop_codon:yes gene_type:complete